jgi:thiazole synthase
LTIAGKHLQSRLLVGSGKYRDLEQTREATEAAGADIITVAIRRVNIGQDPNAPSLLDVLPPSRYTILPNTAGCYNAKDAVYTLQMARELLNGHKLVKLEVLGDEKTLFPHMPETLVAAEALVATVSTSWSTAATIRSRRACWKRSAASRSCRWPR